MFNILKSNLYTVYLNEIIILTWVELLRVIDTWNRLANLFIIAPNVMKYEDMKNRKRVGKTLPICPYNTNFWKKIKNKKSLERIFPPTFSSHNCDIRVRRRRNVVLVNTFLYFWENAINLNINFIQLSLKSLL